MAGGVHGSEGAAGFGVLAGGGFLQALDGESAILRYSAAVEIGLTFFELSVSFFV